MCADRIEFKFLGEGVPLYLEFTLWVLSLLAMAVAIIGFHALITNSINHDCIKGFYLI
jgi:hypothetical protein